jgi:hypothetical protein
MLVLQPEDLLEVNEISAQRKKLQSIIWRMTEDDELKSEIDAAVKEVEIICRPALKHVSWFRFNFKVGYVTPIYQVRQFLRKFLPR